MFRTLLLLYDLNTTGYVRSFVICINRKLVNFTRTALFPPKKISNTHVSFTRIIKQCTLNNYISKLRIINVVPFTP